MNNIAIYLDELAEEPEVACKLARDLGFSNICIRRVWGGNISKITDDNCKSLLASIKKHSLKVVAVCSDVGKVPANEINSLSLIGDFRRSLILTNYFHAKYLRLYTGLRTNKDSAVNIDPKITTWMETIAKETTDCGITPLLEVDQDNYIADETPLSNALANTKYWRLLYDPAIISLRRPANYALKYWGMFGGYISCLDLHDHHPENGFVAVGSGTVGWPQILADCFAANYQGWFFLEPGKTKRNNINNDRPNICSLALKAFEILIAEARKKFLLANSSANHPRR